MTSEHKTRVQKNNNNKQTYNDLNLLVQVIIFEAYIVVLFESCPLTPVERDFLHLKITYSRSSKRYETEACKHISIIEIILRRQYVLLQNSKLANC